MLYLLSTLQYLVMLKQDQVLVLQQELHIFGGHLIQAFLQQKLLHKRQQVHVHLIQFNLLVSILERLLMNQIVQMNMNYRLFGETILSVMLHLLLIILRGGQPQIMKEELLGAHPMLILPMKIMQVQVSYGTNFKLFPLTLVEILTVMHHMRGIKAYISLLQDRVEQHFLMMIG